MAKNKTVDHDFERDGYRTLFLEWMTEWKQEAASTQHRIQYTYANAIKSLKSYPLPIYSGHGCIKLNYFGDHTCKKLEKKLTSYLKENKLQRIAASDPFLEATTAEGDPAAAARNAKKKKSPKKKLIASLPDPTQAVSDAPSAAAVKAPRKRPTAKKPTTTTITTTTTTTAPLDDVIRIREEETDSISCLPLIRPSTSAVSISKTRSVEVIPLRPSTSSGYGTAASSSFSTAGLLPPASRSASASSLPEAAPLRSTTGLVFTRGVTTTLIGGGGGFTARTCSASDLEKNGPGGTRGAVGRFSNIPLDEFTLRPGSFDVVLCVDNQEIHGRGNTRSKLDIVAELKKQQLNYSVRSLKAGDFLWIAQEKAESAAREKRKQPRELVLDFIAERKRGDDLAISIKDGRYTCQKFRMKTASLRRIIYIVEDARRFQNKGLSDQAFHQALANIEVQDGFLVKQTDSLEKTADYLMMMTKYLQRTYATKTLKSCSYAQRCEESSVEFSLSLPTQNLLSFSTFSAVAKTNQAKTVSQAFLLHLLALDGMSPAKASAIVAKYPTVRRLMQAYDECPSLKERELLLRDIQFGSGLTKIGPSISKKLCQLYCTTGPLI